MSSTIVGKLDSNPILKTSPAGNKTVVFTLIMNRVKGNQQWETSVECSAWGTLAEGIFSSLHKGDRAIVFGNFGSEVVLDGSANNEKLILYAEAVGPELRFQTAEVKHNRNLQKNTEVEIA
jgi:single-stranded DNA-binding protein